MKVLLIDDHKLFSKSLAIVLSDFPDIEEFSEMCHSRLNAAKNLKEFLWFHFFINKAFGSNFLGFPGNDTWRIMKS